MFLSASPPGVPPAPDVAFAWGSRSTRRVAFSITAREAARLTAVVVFPTPPFWLATAMTWTKPLCSHARQTRVIFQKINGLFYHAGACGRNENLVAVPCPPCREADISAPGTSIALRGKDLPDLPDPHAQRKLDPDGAARDGLPWQRPILLRGLRLPPPPPWAPHREKTPPRNQVREEKRDHLLRREGGPGEDVFEPPECERISRFQPALDHFRVGKGEDTAGVRQERALFRRGLQEDDA